MLLHYKYSEKFILQRYLQSNLSYTQGLYNRVPKMSTSLKMPTKSYKKYVTFNILNTSLYTSSNKNS